MITYSYISKIGNREINEDSVICEQNETLSYFVVADGLGGHGQGEIASGIAIESMKETFSFNKEEKELNEIIDSAILKAQEDILNEQKERHARFDMKTTAVVLCEKENHICWGHIGDSRLYAFVNNKVKVRTLDHSIPQMLVLSGELAERKIRNHPQRNMLLRVLGVDGEELRHEISDVLPLEEFQAFLLCSDGFWELVNEKEMCKLLKKSKNVEEWLGKMTELVEKHGMNKDMDNYTAIAVWVSE